MGIFDKRKSISRPELRSVFRKSSSPTIGGKKYTQKERAAFEKNIFGPKYGSQISKKDYRTAIDKMRRERFKAKDSRGRLEIEKKIGYLKKLGGE